MQGHWGTTDDLATIFLHPAQLLAVMTAKSMSVHSLYYLPLFILSSYLFFFCLSLLFPFTVPCSIVFLNQNTLRYGLTSFLTMVRSLSYSPIFLQTSSATWSFYKICSVTLVSSHLQCLCSFFLKICCQGWYFTGSQRSGYALCLIRISFQFLQIHLLSSLTGIMKGKIVAFLNLCVHYYFRLFRIFQALCLLSCHCSRIISKLLIIPLPWHLRGNFYHNFLATRQYFYISRLTPYMKGEEETGTFCAMKHLNCC